MTVKDISEESTESSCNQDESPCKRDQRLKEKASAERIFHVETCISDEENGDSRNQNELEKERDSLCSWLRNNEGNARRDVYLITRKGKE